MRIDFIHTDGRECWACFDESEGLFRLTQLACKSLDLRLALRDAKWMASGLYGYEWCHWPLEGELALYAYRVAQQEEMP